MSIPIEHINDSQKLQADGEIDLFELTPALGSGTIYFKDGNPVTWRSQLYEGLPVTFTGHKQSAENPSAKPNMMIGQPDVDISAFKPLVFDGGLDGATIMRTHILLDDMINNRLIRNNFYYRVKRVESYGRSRISLQLAALSDSLNFSIPFKQYLPPGFPAVSI